MSSNRVGDTLLATSFWSQIISDLSSLNFSAPIWNQVEKAFLMFQFYSDISGQATSGTPLFDTFIAPCIWIGLGASLRHFVRLPGLALLLIVFFMTIVFGQILLGSTPYWPKIISVMLVGSVLVAIGLRLVSSALGDIARGIARLTLSQPGGAYAVVGGIEVIAVSVLLSVVGMREWDNFYRNASGFAGPVERLGRMVESLPTNYKICSILSPGEISVNRKEIQFYGYPRELLDLTDIPLSEAVKRCSPGPLMWLINVTQPELREALRPYYPSGRLETHYGKESVMFWTLTVD